MAEESKECAPFIYHLSDSD